MGSNNIKVSIYYGITAGWIGIYYVRGDSELIDKERHEICQIASHERLKQVFLARLP